MRNALIGTKQTLSSMRFVDVVRPEELIALVVFLLGALHVGQQVGLLMMFVGLAMLAFRTQGKRVLNVPILLFLLVVALKDCLTAVSLSSQGLPAFLLYESIIYAACWLLLATNLFSLSIETIALAIISVLMYTDAVYLISVLSEGYSRVLVESVGASVNLLAAFNLISLPFMFSLVSRPGINVTVRFLAKCSILLSELIVLLSGSRASIIILIVLLALVFFIGRGAVKEDRLKKALLFNLIVVGVLVALYAANDLQAGIVSLGLDRFFSKLSEQDSDRLIFFSQGWNAFLQSNLWIGSGDTRTYINFAGMILFSQPHNVFLEILLESGFIGLVLFVVGQILFLKEVISNSEPGPERALAGLTYFSGFAVSLVNPFMTSSMAFVALLVFCVAGLAVSSRRTSR